MGIDLKTGIVVVIALLWMIVQLMTVPQPERPRALRNLLVWAVAILLLIKLGPAILTLILAAGVLEMDHPRKAMFIGGAAFAVWGIVYFTRLIWLDHKENRLIRAGSQEAFERRVEEYVSTFGYGRERAIETTTRIRDRK